MEYFLYDKDKQADEMLFFNQPIEPKKYIYTSVLQYKIQEKQFKHPIKFNALQKQFKHSLKLFTTNKYLAVEGIALYWDVNEGGLMIIPKLQSKEFTDLNTISSLSVEKTIFLDVDNTYNDEVKKLYSKLCVVAENLCEEVNKMFAERKQKLNLSRKLSRNFENNQNKNQASKILDEYNKVISDWSKINQKIKEIVPHDYTVYK